MALPPCSRLPSVDQEYPWGPQGAHAGRTLRPQAPDGQRTRKEPPPRRTSQQVRTMPANHGRALKKRENSFESHIHAQRDWRGAVCDRRSADHRTGRRPLGHPARASGRGVTWCWTVADVTTAASSSDSGPTPATTFRPPTARRVRPHAALAADAPSGPRCRHRARLKRLRADDNDQLPRRDPAAAPGSRFRLGVVATPTMRN